MVDFETLAKVILDPIKRPLYVQRSQSKTDPKHISDCSEDEIFHTYPELRWGHATYTVNEDGTLNFMEADFDTSG